MFEIPTNFDAAYAALGLEIGKATVKDIKAAAKIKSKSIPGSTVSKLLAGTLEDICIQHLKFLDTQAPEGEKKVRATKADNDKRDEILEMFVTMEIDGKKQGDIIKAVRAQYKLTYPNAYYYWGRVYQEDKASITKEVLATIAARNEKK